MPLLYEVVSGTVMRMRTSMLQLEWTGRDHDGTVSEYLCDAYAVVCRTAGTHRHGSVSTRMKAYAVDFYHPGIELRIDS